MARRRLALAPALKIKAKRLRGGKKSASTADKVVMSGSVSSKFQDHYSILGVEPRADSEMIQTAYSRMAQKYHPNNPDTGNVDKFDAVNQAYEVLSDPSLRIEFDKVKGIDPDAGNPKFTGLVFFDALRQSSLLRAAILCLLYDRRRMKPFKASLSMRHVEGMIQADTEDLNFALWYLKQRALVASDDKSSLQITVEGMDYLEKNQPTAQDVLPLIKEDSVATSPEPEKPEVAARNGSEPVLRILSRALNRYATPEESNTAVKK
jgi:hypothetical protein